MSRSPIANRLQPWRLLIAAILVGCAATAPATDGSPKEYKDLEDTMADEIDPVVEAIMPGELRKDPDAVDYPRIAAAARKAAYYFKCATDSSHAMYLGKQKQRDGAVAANGWFVAIATAATAKQHAELVRLYTQKNTICSACHDY